MKTITIQGGTLGGTVRQFTTNATTFGELKLDFATHNISLEGNQVLEQSTRNALSTDAALLPDLPVINLFMMAQKTKSGNGWSPEGFVAQTPSAPVAKSASDFFDKAPGYAETTGQKAMPSGSGTANLFDNLSELLHQRANLEQHIVAVQKAIATSEGGAQPSASMSGW